MEVFFCFGVFVVIVFLFVGFKKRIEVGMLIMKSVGVLFLYFLFSGIVCLVLMGVVYDEVLCCILLFGCGSYVVE